MRTVSSCVTDKEYVAVVEFANQYGEPVSGAIKKAIFDVAALANEDCPSGFELKMECPEGEDEYGHSLSDVLFAGNIDNVRQIAGLPELDLYGYKKERREGKPSDVKQSNEQEKCKKYLSELDLYGYGYNRKIEGKASDVKQLNEQAVPAGKELMINRIARMIREESKLIKSDAEGFSG